MKTLLIIIVLLLTGCGEKCRWTVAADKRDKQAELFDKCLVRAAEARQGVSYTTNDDEDYDEVIKECYRASNNILSERVCKPRW